MRALGPGSVASLLKIALDVAYVVLWIAVGAVCLALVGLSLPFLGAVHGSGTLNGHPEDLADLVRRWPAMAAFLVAVGLYVLALGLIVNRLRRVFETLIQGDPFRPANVRRLRVVGLSLIGLEAIGYLVRMALIWLAPEGRESISLSISLSGWFAILAVFVLAEVFREGARLRSDAELTI